MERVELKTHTTASAMRGVITPQRLVIQAKKYGMKALAITDINTVAAFPEINDAAKELYPELKIIYGIEAACKDISGTIHRYTVLAENRQGLMNLYKLITYTNITADRQGFSISEKTLKEYREGLLIGGDSFDGICDYVQITPYADREHNIRIVNEGKACGKPVVVTGNVYTIDDTDIICRNILCHSTEEKASEYTHFLSTSEMMNTLSYLGEDTYMTVVENSVKIADRIEKIDPIPQNPQLKPSEKVLSRIRDKCYERLFELYGNHPPIEFLQRFEDEVVYIESHNLDLLYDTAFRLSEWNTALGYRHILSGDLERSFVAYLLGASEVNPLPPHYRCPACKSVIAYYPEGTVSGYDLNKTGCPVCGSEMYGDGQNMNLDCETIPKISIGIYPPLFCEAIDYTCSLFGDSTLLSAGKTMFISNNTAKRMIHEYVSAHDDNLSEEIISNVIERLTRVESHIMVRSSSLILPLPETVFPLCFSCNNVDSMILGMQFDEKYIRRFAAVVDEYEDYIPEIYKELERFTGVSVDDVKLDDPEIYKTISSGDVLGLSRYDTEQLRDAGIHIQPKKFCDLLKIFAYVNKDTGLSKNVLPFARLAWYKVHCPAEFYAVILNHNKVSNSGAKTSNKILLESKETLSSLVNDIESRRNSDSAFTLAEEEMLYDRLLITIDAMNHGIAFLPSKYGVSDLYKYIPDNGCIRLPLE